MMTIFGFSSTTVVRMPVISRFFGIVISMYHEEHGVAHFHARYGGYKISVEVQTGAVHGTFPPRALRLVREWHALHRDELLDDWVRVRRHEPVVPIAPLR